MNLLPYLMRSATYLLHEMKRMSTNILVIYTAHNNCLTNACLFTGIANPTASLQRRSWRKPLRPFVLSNLQHITKSIHSQIRRTHSMLQEAPMMLQLRPAMQFQPQTSSPQRMGLRTPRKRIAPSRRTRRPTVRRRTA